MVWNPTYLGRNLSPTPVPVCQPGPVQPDDTLSPTPRATLRRKRERGSHERDLINTILDEALVCHVGFAADHGPVVLPMTYVRMGDDLYLHGAAGNDMLRHLADGTDLCVTVTLLDGLVLARSAFHHSMNYRCVVLFGQAQRVTDTAELLAASAGLLDHLAPGRSADARPPNPAELRATLMVRLRISEGSAKVRTGGPIEDPEDLELPVWAGELPLALAARPPVAATDLRDGVAVPAYINRLADRD
jgi:nitroimidazol reductase NimA-like FMN-containing flavoprotein (pyridoxamine 5'-phosphate oxidase superfamily)